MYLLDVIPLTRIPHAQPQILSYFSGQKLPAGAVVQIPLGRRKEEGIIIGSRDIASSKMEIKNADFELRNIGKILSTEPVLTKQQIELALFLGQYYFCSPGIFAKMMLAKKPTTDYRLPTTDKKQTLILVPIISRAYSSYPSYPPDTVIWHSGLTQKQKNAAWLAVKTDRAQTIIGTRSAVFLPFNNLKKIIIEDETNHNHKSWDMFPHYDSRLAAKKLAEIFKAQLRVSAGRGHKRRAASRPAGGTRTGMEWLPGANGLAPPTPLPQIIDMRQELKDGNFSIFSVDLYEAVKNALSEKQQVILFINRRGAANFILCRDCGYVAKCPNCDAPMAYHLVNTKPALLCHHCGVKDIPPKNCPHCHSWRIKTVGSGSQKVATEAHNFFPDAKILRLDSDNAPKPKDQQKIIAEFVEKEADILIATPMIFSWLTELATVKPSVVAILSADTLLHIPDFRSGERTFQTIITLQNLLCTPHFKKGGSGGDFNHPQFIIQTYNPDNSVLKYIKNNDYNGFVKEDMETRQALSYPPFSQIVKLTFRHRDAKKAGQETKILQAKLQNIISTHSVIPAKAGIQRPIEQLNNLNSGFRLKAGMTKNNKDTNSIELSPALPAFLPRERGKYVWNIIVKFPPLSAPSFEKSSFPPPLCKGGVGGIFTASNFLTHRNSLLQYIPTNWEIDVDPENLL